MNAGWKCPSCGRCWAPFVAECPGPHGSTATSGFLPVGVRCSTCGVVFTGSHSCAILTSKVPND